MLNPGGSTDISHNSLKRLSLLQHAQDLRGKFEEFSAPGLILQAGFSAKNAGELSPPR
jgi:hypothetical protein